MSRLNGKAKEVLDACLSPVRLAFEKWLLQFPREPPVTSATLLVSSKFIQLISEDKRHTTLSLSLNCLMGKHYHQSCLRLTRAFIENLHLW